jgi:hypothetical protein
LRASAGERPTPRGLGLNAYREANGNPTEAAAVHTKRSNARRPKRRGTGKTEERGDRNGEPEPWGCSSPRPGQAKL